MYIHSIMAFTKIIPGEVFSIKTSKGYGFLQFIENNDMGIQIVRVLEPLKQEKFVTQKETDIKERYVIGFAVTAALKRKIIDRAVVLKIPDHFKTPKETRTKHMIRGEFLGWHIVNQKTLKRRLVYSLTPKEIELSPSGCPNDTLLIEWLETDWRLENWK